MLIRKLQVAGLRSFEQAEFTFQPGMNLLVGVNGVGKTTVLDALRICLSRVLPEITASRSQKHNFRESDINKESNSLEVRCTIQLRGIPFNVLVQKYRQKPIATAPGEPTLQLNTIEDIQPALSKVFHGEPLSQQPLAVYFSTKRSLIVEQRFTLASAAGRQASAFADSLSSNRELNLRLHAEWFKAQEELGKENPIASKHIDVLRLAVSQFLPGFQNLHTVDSGRSVSFVIEKDGIKLQLTQLSDGERGILSLVLDLARRLSQANPDLENPVKDGVGVVLIDELDLHLHPKWQRSIVENLTRTFPNCQFIATTHSPQIIPAVEPERVQLLKDNKVIHPDRTLGMDSNWILRNIMETDERPEEAEQAIEKVTNLINEGDYELARASMADYRQQGLDLPEWSTLEAQIARFEMFNGE